MDSMYLNYSILWVPVFILPLLLIWIINKTRNPNPNRNPNHPPSPPMLPVLGNLHQMSSLPHQSMWDLSKKYGPIMYLRFGFVPNVVVSSAETAKEVLRTYDLECCSKPRLAGTRRLTYNFLDVAFSPYTDTWREMRKLAVLHVFSMKRIESFRFIRENEVGSLVDSLIGSPNNPAVNVTDKLYALTASIVFRMAFGKSFQGSGIDHSSLRQLLIETSGVAGIFSANDYFPYVGWILDLISGYHAKVERVFQKLDTIYEEAINGHFDPERKKTNQTSIVDVMVEIEREQTESGELWITRNHIKAILLNMFLGGIDTTSVTMVWAMTELVRNPNVMKKAQDEIRNYVGNKDKVTEDDIGHLDYLKLVIKETLRLHPVVPLLVVRETRSHIKINGYDILPKTIVHVNAWGIGRDPKYWNNPEEFIPDRFIDNPIDFRGQHFDFLTFGSGRRICPGMNMGLATIEIALANLLYRFDWELPDGMKKEDIDMNEVVGVILSKKTPLFLKPIDYIRQDV